MFILEKRINGGHSGDWETVGEYLSFDEARKAGQEKVCPDICHEGDKASSYWFSDESDPNTGYAGHIKFIA